MTHQGPKCSENQFLLHYMSLYVPKRWLLNSMKKGQNRQFEPFIKIPLEVRIFTVSSQYSVCNVGGVRGIVCQNIGSEKETMFDFRSQASNWVRSRRGHMVLQSYWKILKDSGGRTGLNISIEIDLFHVSCMIIDKW